MFTRGISVPQSLVAGIAFTSGCSSFSATINKIDDAGVTAGGTSSSSTATGVTGGSPSGNGGASTAVGGTAASSSSGTTSSSSTASGGTPSTGGASGSAGTATTVGGFNAAGGQNSTAGSTPGGSSTGSTNSGGASAGPSGGTVGTGGVASTGGTAATGGSAQPVCSGTTPDTCSSSCTNLQTDKSNCGACGTSCQSYQFCAGGACLPQYVSTKVLPTQSLASGSSVQIQSAAVETNKTQGDLLVQLSLADSTVTMSAPTDTSITQVSTSTPSGGSGYTAIGLARYTANGTLAWGRDLLGVLGATSQRGVDSTTVSPFVLNSTGDVMVAYYWQDPPPTGPARQTSQMYLGRVNSDNANLMWAAVYSASALDVTTIVPRSAKSDYVTFGVNGEVWQVVENTSSESATATRLGVDNFSGALPDVNGATTWLYGFGYAGTFALNPWSTQTWNITSNPNGGADAFIIGVKDDGTSVGPWMSEGDWGPQYRVAMDTAGDLLVAASSSGYTTFNGGQDFITKSTGGNVLVKIDHTNGQIIWRTELTTFPTMLTAVAGNRVVTMQQQLDSSTLAPIATAPYQLDIYSTTDGTHLSSLSAGMMAQTIAAGTKDLFVLGTVSAASDFDPGTGVDSQGSAAGVYISRYSF